MIYVLGPRPPEIGGVVKFLDELARYCEADNVDLKLINTSRFSNRFFSLIHEVLLVSTLFAWVKMTGNSLVLNLSDNIKKFSLFYYLSSVFNKEAVVILHNGKSLTLFRNRKRAALRFAVVSSKNFGMISPHEVRIPPVSLDIKGDYTKLKLEPLKRDLTIMTSGLLVESTYNFSCLVDHLLRFAFEHGVNIELQIYAPSNSSTIAEKLRAKSTKNCKVDVILDVSNFSEKVSDCDIYIRSTTVDSFGIAIVEAALKGKRVLSTDIPGRIPLGERYNVFDYDSFSDSLQYLIKRHYIDYSYLNSLPNFRTLIDFILSETNNTIL